MASKKRKRKQTKVDLQQLKTIIANEVIEDNDMAKEMENSILLYAVSTITDRALPNVYDGCKPVIRRILYGGYTHKYLPEKQHIKCATYAGQVMSDCHPHGIGV